MLPSAMPYCTSASGILLASMLMLVDSEFLCSNTVLLCQYSDFLNKWGF